MCCVTVGLHNHSHPALARPCEFIDDELGDPVSDANFVDGRRVNGQLVGGWLRTARANTTVCNKYFIEQPANHHTTLEVHIPLHVAIAVAGC